MNILRALALILMVVFLPVESARADEEIINFNANIDLASNGELTVVETISVISEGRDIKRGIYRDLPTLIETANGRQIELDFDVLSVKRDGVDEPFHYEFSRGVMRVYIGDANVFLEPGRYEYEITYKTDRQIRYFEEHDELYWNVTGTEWIFPIRQASAVVNLPAGAKALATNFFTGSYGASNKDARAFFEEDGNRVIFVTTESLGRREGLSVVVSFEKGVIAPPSEADKAYWFLRDYASEVFAVGTLIIILFYYLTAWWFVGRDPPKGVIVPNWQPPEGVSPALVNYIHNKGLRGKGWDAIGSALVSLAVKGYVTLTNLSHDMTITKTDKAGIGQLPVGERALYTSVSARSAFSLTRDNSSAVVSMTNGFRNAMEREHRKVFYEKNRGISIFGIILSAIGIIGALLFSDEGAELIPVILPFLIFGGLILSKLLPVLRDLSSGGKLSGKIANVIGLGIVLIFVLSSSGAVFYDLLLSATFAIQSFLIAPVAAIVFLNILFFFLLGAPTPLGRKMMDQIEGLALYIRLAEKDRMNLKDAPDMSPQHFETLLPFAVALGLERPWSQTFETWLSSASAAQAGLSTYQPGWSGGRMFDGGDIGRTIGDIGGSISNSLTASMPPPKSSSSGFSSGGGFSGGGGGGGGGGGW